jgi:hypothetical protein
MLGYDNKMPAIVAQALPPDAIPVALVEPGNTADNARPDEVLPVQASGSVTPRIGSYPECALNADGSVSYHFGNWFRTMLHGLRLCPAANLKFELDAAMLGAETQPRLRGIALEVVPTEKMLESQANGYFAASVSLPTNEEHESTVLLSKRQIGRIRRVNTNLAPPGPELSDFILNACPVGSWTIELSRHSA